jgi:hypothetical protein
MATDAEICNNVDQRSLRPLRLLLSSYGTRSGEGELFKNLCKNGFKSALVPMQSATQGYAKFCRRSHDASIGVFDDSGALIETHQSDGAFREP